MVHLTLLRGVSGIPHTIIYTKDSDCIIQQTQRCLPLAQGHVKNSQQSGFTEAATQAKGYGSQEKATGEHADEDDDGGGREEKGGEEGREEKK